MKWISPKDYPGYRELVPSWDDKLMDWLNRGRFSLVIRPRYLIVSAMLLLSFLQFGATYPKAAAVSLASYCLMVLPLGTRHIERAALVVFAIAAVLWMELIPHRLLEFVQAQ